MNKMQFIINYSEINNDYKSIQQKFNDFRIFYNELHEWFKFVIVSFEGVKCTFIYYE